MSRVSVSMFSAGLVVFIATCGGGGEPGADTTATDAPDVETVETDPLANLTMDRIIRPVGEPLSRLQGADGLEFAATENDTIIISGEAESGRAGGTTAGVAFVIRGEDEQSLAGAKVDFQIVARAVDQDEGSVRAAFSTNDSGNSGWSEFALTSEFATYEFTYDVPPLERGRNDYLGLQPVGGPVEIAAIGWTIVEAASQASDTGDAATE